MTLVLSLFLNLPEAALKVCVNSARTTDERAYLRSHTMRR